MKVIFPRERCLDRAAALGREWLETNGRGGYAASTIFDCHTRKYHGLLVVPLHQPAGRFVLLSKVEPTLLCDGQAWELGCNQYPGVFHPRGHEHLARWQSELFPAARYRVGGLDLTRAVMMPRDDHAVLLRFTLHTAPAPVVLRLQPLLAYRDHHALTRENFVLNPRGVRTGDAWQFSPYPGLPPLYLQLAAGEFLPGPFWVRNVEFAAERDRGFDYQEDLFCPGVFEVPLAPGESVVLRAGLAPAPVPGDALWTIEETRRRQARAHPHGTPPGLALLQANAAQFLIRNTRGEASVIAGYPWFGEWGRDTLIALPGLTCACGRPRDALAVLRTFATYERAGLLPNYLNLGDQPPAYNSLDAALWFFWALHEYVAAMRQPRAAAEFLPVAGRIIEAYLDGRVPHARLRPDGLIEAGNAGTQHTWMDACVNGQPVTSRHGLAVEINALWYHALSFYLEQCAANDRRPDGRLDPLRRRLASAFVHQFWLPEHGYLADSVNERGPDLAVRPNQIFAVALPHSPLSPVQMAAVVARVQDELLTPFGLRTLSPRHPAYRGTYAGGPESRDGAYHQGTVWPWLVGAFVTAALRVATDPAATRATLRQRLAPLFEEHLADAGIGHISEVFDGDPPHRPGGCFAQAWSLAEVVRAWRMLDGKGGA